MIYHHIYCDEYVTIMLLKQGYREVKRMKENYREEIIKKVQKINEERFLRYLYMLINEMIAQNK